jgi:hypothetical protein
VLAEEKLKWLKAQKKLNESLLYVELLHPLAAYQVESDPISRILYCCRSISRSYQTTLSLQPIQNRELTPDI